MLKVIFDSNVYDKILLDKESDRLIISMAQDNDFKVYGYKIIKKELEDTSKKKCLKEK